MAYTEPDRPDWIWSPGQEFRAVVARAAPNLVPYAPPFLGAPLWIGADVLGIPRSLRHDTMFGSLAVVLIGTVIAFFLARAIRRWAIRSVARCVARERGRDICLKCGYESSADGRTATTCSECGTKNPGLPDEQIRGDRTWIAAQTILGPRVMNRLALAQVPASAVRPRMFEVLRVPGPNDELRFRSPSRPHRRWFVLGTGASIAATTMFLYSLAVQHHATFPLLVLMLMTSINLPMWLGTLDRIPNAAQRAATRELRRRLLESIREDGHDVCLRCRRFGDGDPAAGTTCRSCGTVHSPITTPAEAGPPGD